MVFGESTFSLTFPIGCNNCLLQIFKPKSCKFENKTHKASNSFWKKNGIRNFQQIKDFCTEKSFS